MAELDSHVARRHLYSAGGTHPELPLPVFNMVKLKLLDQTINWFIQLLLLGDDLSCCFHEKYMKV